MTYERVFIQYRLEQSAGRFPSPSGRRIARLRRLRRRPTMARRKATVGRRKRQEAGA